MRVQGATDGEFPDDRGAWSLQHLVLLANGPHARYVRHLQVGLDTYLPTQPVDQVPRDGGGQGPTLHDLNQNQNWHEYIKVLHSVLPTCLQKFTGLKSLDFLGMACLHSGWEDYSMWDRVPHEAEMGPRYQLLADTLVSSLRYAQLPDLEELNLRLPLTPGFKQLVECLDGDQPAAQSTSSPTSIIKVIHGIRHLRLAISDSNNSALEKQEHILTLIPMAKSLESLAISARCDINLDSLRLESHVRLTTLDLQELLISSKPLLHILDQCKESLTAVRLDQVILESVSDSHDRFFWPWEKILEKLAECLQLKHFLWHDCQINKDCENCLSYHPRCPMPSLIGPEFILDEWHSSSMSPISTRQRLGKGEPLLRNVRQRLVDRVDETRRAAGMESNHHIFENYRAQRRAQRVPDDRRYYLSKSKESSLKSITSYCRLRDYRVEGGRDYSRREWEEFRGKHGLTTDYPEHDTYALRRRQELYPSGIIGLDELDRMKIIRKFC